MDSRLGIRQSTLPFNPDAFYRFYNDKLPDFRMSLGVTTYLPGPFNMTTVGTSSENWQLYGQGGRFFFRNYDHSADYQLGLDEASAQIPTMLRRSGALGQQWSIIRIDEGADKGKWRVTNGMLGNETMLAVGSVGTIPQMSSGTDGSAWDIRLNIGPDRDDTPKNMDMMVNVLSMEVASTSTSTTSSISSTPSASSTTAINASVTTSTSKETPTPKSSSLSGGAIAGIAIGGVLLIAAIFFLVFFLLKRRKRNAPYQQHYPTPNEKPAELEVYEQRQELGPGLDEHYRKSHMQARNAVIAELG